MKTWFLNLSYNVKTSVNWWVQVQTDLARSTVPLDALLRIGGTIYEESLRYGDFNEGKLFQGLQDFLNKSRMGSNHFDRDKLSHDLYYSTLYVVEVGTLITCHLFVAFKVITWCEHPTRGIEDRPHFLGTTWRRYLNYSQLFPTWTLFMRVRWDVSGGHVSLFFFLRSSTTSSSIYILRPRTCHIVSITAIICQASFICRAFVRHLVQRSTIMYVLKQNVLVDHSIWGI